MSRSGAGPLMLRHSQLRLLAFQALVLAGVAPTGYAPSVPAAPALVRTYVNPVYGQDFPDPFVLRYRGRFYAYATQKDDRGFQMMESPDLVHWQYRGAAFKPPWSSRHLWAPEVVQYRGRFYMTYSALNPATGKHDIGIATAPSPLGPFRHAAILVPGENNRFGVIDATLFFEADGTSYLIYSEEEPRRIVLRRMRRDLLAAADGVMELLRPDRDAEHGITEAPTLIRKNGRYHLFFSAGWYQSSRQNANYAVYHAEARALLGPYVKSPEPVLKTIPGQVYSPGHQCLVQLPSGETWIFYHGWDSENEPRYGSNPRGRTLRLDRLWWRGEEPFVDGPSTTPRTAPQPGK